MANMSTRFCADDSIRGKNLTDEVHYKGNLDLQNVQPKLSSSVVSPPSNETHESLNHSLISDSTSGNRSLTISNPTEQHPKRTPSGLNPTFQNRNPFTSPFEKMQDRIQQHKQQHGTKNTVGSEHGVTNTVAGRSNDTSSQNTVPQVDKQTIIKSTAGLVAQSAMSLSTVSPTSTSTPHVGNIQHGGSMSSIANPARPVKDGNGRGSIGSSPSIAGRSPSGSGANAQTSNVHGLPRRTPSHGQHGGFACGQQGVVVGGQTGIASQNNETRQRSVNYDEEQRLESSWINRVVDPQFGSGFVVHVDPSYIQDTFNLFNLHLEMQTFLESKISEAGGWFPMDLFSKALDRILDKDNSVSIVLEYAAQALYGLVHSRFLLTPNGLDLMFQKYMDGVYGLCPLEDCRKRYQKVLPVGLSDQLGVNSTKIYCPRCREIYESESAALRHVDGAVFGTNLPSMFLLTFDLVSPQQGSHSNKVNPYAVDSMNDTTAPMPYCPRIFGFKVSSTSKTRVRKEYEEELRREGKTYAWQGGKESLAGRIR